MQSAVTKLLLSVGVAVGAIAVAAGPVAAECGAFDPWPAFTQAAPSARIVILGEVTEQIREDSANNALEFRFHVDDILRGDSDVERTFNAFRTGAPLSICPDNSFLRVHVGDRLAFAFDAHASGFPGRVNTVAFINRTPDDFLLPGVQRLSEAQVRAAASGLPPTDMTRNAGPADNSIALWAFVLAATCGWVVLGRRRLRP